MPTGSTSSSTVLADRDDANRLMKFIVENNVDLFSLKEANECCHERPPLPGLNRSSEDSLLQPVVVRNSGHSPLVRV